MKTTSRRLPQERELHLSDLAEVAGLAQHLPIDPLAILRAEQITNSFNDYGGAFDGLLEWRPRRFHVYCDLSRVEKRDSPRARFTLAHELGHYFIDEHRNALMSGQAPRHASFCDFQSPHLVEVEADCFASSLLMPRSRFQASAKKAGSDLEGVVQLAKQYCTSITATALRLVQLDLTPCVVLKWEGSCYGWKRLSASAFALGYRKTVDDPARLPRDCPTAKVLAGADGVLTAATTASTWFPFIQGSSDRNPIFTEQAISLGRFGALTFLTLIDRLSSSGG
jgi:hypothetical protein